MVLLRKEATIQAVDSVLVWDCTLACYDRRFIEEGGADVEDTYVTVTFVPFEEAKQNASVAAYPRERRGGQRRRLRGAGMGGDAVLPRRGERGRRGRRRERPHPGGVPGAGGQRPRLHRPTSTARACSRRLTSAVGRSAGAPPSCRCRTASSSGSPPRRRGPSSAAASSPSRLIWSETEPFRGLPGHLTTRQGALETCFDSGQNARTSPGGQEVPTRSGPRTGQGRRGGTVRRGRWIAVGGRGGVGRGGAVGDGSPGAHETSRSRPPTRASPPTRSRSRSWLRSTPCRAPRASSRASSTGSRRGPSTPTTNGGLAGRYIEVNFVDSRLSGDEARNRLHPGVRRQLRPHRHLGAVPPELRGPPPRRAPTRPGPPPAFPTSRWWSPRSIISARRSRSGSTRRPAPVRQNRA